MKWQLRSSVPYVSWLFAYAGNFLLAVIGVAIVEGPFVGSIHLYPMTAATLQTVGLIDFVLALLLGSLVCWRWRVGAALWVWTCGAVWLGVAEIQGVEVGHLVAITFSGARNSPVSIEEFGLWIACVVPPLRALGYSFGGWLATRLLFGSAPRSS